jgi:hypothetical protein
MAWYLHVTEGENGRWSCSHGRYHFDSHEDVSQAVSQLRAIARASLDGPAMVVVHRRDGVIETVGAESDMGCWSSS